MKILLTCVIGFLQYLQTTVNANWQQGLCLGQHIQAQSSYTQDECLYDCKNHLNCNFATFDTKNKICHLNSGCSKVVKFDDAKYKFTKKDSKFKGQRYLMVASGHSANADATVEVIDLLGNPSTSFCRNLPEFPQPNVTDGLAAIFNASPLICGGATDNEDEFSSKCYHLIDDSWVLGPTMTTSRSQASILTMGNEDEGSEMLLVTGGSGKSGEGSLKSTEKLNVTSVQWESSFQLPKPSYGHCAVEINSTTILIIGGGTQQFGSKSTKIMHINDGKTQNGPKLRQKRREHSCGILRKNNTKYVIVSGGISQNMLKSTETLHLTENLNDQQWRSGPDLPTALTKSQMLSDEDSVYLIGGMSDTQAMSTIWRLFDVDNNWIESKHRLSIGRAGHVALFLPQKLTQCYSEQKRID